MISSIWLFIISFILFVTGAFSYMVRTKTFFVYIGKVYEKPTTFEISFMFLGLVGVFIWIFSDIFKS